MRFHTSLPVTDIAKTVEFYRVLLGTEPVKTKPDYAKFLRGDGLNITFHTNPEGVAKLRSLHLGFELESQAALDAEHARLEVAGLISAARETSICCYANQDKFWVRDPDGYEWELYYLVQDTDVKIAAATACCAPQEAGATAQKSSCC